MGTRALTFVYESYKDEQGKVVHQPIINLYRQYDGYPSGHGVELAEFLQRGRLVNGLSGRDDVVFNGMGCLAAQLVANFKKESGGFYLHPVTAVDCGQDYEYHVYENGDRKICVRVTDRGCNMFGLTMSDKNENLFDGTVDEFFNYCYEDA